MTLKETRYILRELTKLPLQLTEEEKLMLLSGRTVIRCGLSDEIKDGHAFSIYFFEEVEGETKFMVGGFKWDDDEKAHKHSYSHQIYLD